MTTTESKVGQIYKIDVISAGFYYLAVIVDCDTPLEAPRRTGITYRAVRPEDAEREIGSQIRAYMIGDEFHPDISNDYQNGGYVGHIDHIAGSERWVMRQRGLV